MRIGTSPIYAKACLPTAPISPDQIYPMPVESADLEAAAAQYAETLRRIAGSPPVLDLVHLGLGGDGHTASLVPDDPVLHVENADVALSGPYQDRRRMTLTYPLINRARRVLWVVTGSEKVEMSGACSPAIVRFRRGVFAATMHWYWRIARQRHCSQPYEGGEQHAHRNCYRSRRI